MGYWHDTRSLTLSVTPVDDDRLLLWTMALTRWRRQVPHVQVFQQDELIPGVDVPRNLDLPAVLRTAADRAALRL